VVNRLRPSKVESLASHGHHRLVGGLVGDLLQAFVANPGKCRAHPPDLMARCPEQHLVQPAHGVVLARSRDAEGFDPVLRLSIG
jgi:hypothetical protein